MFVTGVFVTRVELLRSLVVVATGDGAKAELIHQIRSLMVSFREPEFAWSSEVSFARPNSVNFARIDLIPISRYHACPVVFHVRSYQNSAALIHKMPRAGPVESHVAVCH